MKRTIIILIVVNLVFVMNIGLVEAQEKRITDDFRLDVKTENIRIRLLNTLLRGDKEAFKKALVAGLMTGECVQFKANERVPISDTAIFSGLVKVRRPGEISEYWTNIEAVK